MRSFLDEFKKFAMRGNVIDLAVGIVIGAAFQKIVTSLVDNIIMPSFGILLGGTDFSGLLIKVGESEITYGVFVQSIVDFIIIAFAIFVAVKLMNEMQKKENEKPEKEKVAEPTEEVKLLREIRDAVQSDSKGSM